MSADADRPLTIRQRATAMLEVGYPRPQLVRESWFDLTGVWSFGFDDHDGDDDAGGDKSWQHHADHLNRDILVPFPFESPASGIGDTGLHPVVWYRRSLDFEGFGAVVTAAGAGARIILHFGAVDYRADVWLHGQYLGGHEGGHTPFSFDVTHEICLDPELGLVVRAADDPHDVAQPRGKQDWETQPHGIWYFRTSGIWQPVWLEIVPALHLTDLAWIPNATSDQVELQVELNREPHPSATVEVHLSYDGQTLADVSFHQKQKRGSTVINIPRQVNGQAYESLLWSPENPRLIDAVVQIRDEQGDERDEVYSYFGLRTADFADGHFLLNDRPYYVRAVLEQGYWPESHLAAPHKDALRDEVLLAKSLGFNTVRIHEKIEDPVYFYWADRLGLLVWAESPSCFEYSATAVERNIREWMETIRRDKSHPCIVTWVPLNESWGVQHIAHQLPPLNYARSLYHLTKALDPTRLVISNDGWEHVESDIWTIHDYSATGAELSANYSDHATVEHLLSGLGPLGRRMQLLDLPDRGQPVIVSEFGGVSYAPDLPHDAWGYVTAAEPSIFQELLTDQFHALQASPVIAGFCYTQLTDTLQEANGLADSNRQPKLPSETVRAIVLGLGVDTSAHRRPKKPEERPIEAVPISRPSIHDEWRAPKL